MKDEKLFKFIIFYGDQYYPKGGAKDGQIVLHCTLEDAMDKVNSFIDMKKDDNYHEVSFDWIHLLEVDRGKIVFEADLFER